MAIGRDLRKYPGGCSNWRPGTGGGRSCLTPWARQGVLLLNTALTVREGCAGAHIGWGWQHFTDRVINAIASASQPVVFMLWGKEAQAKRDRIGGQHLVLCDRHPRTGLEENSQPFSGANDYLQHHGREPINWLDVCSRPPANAGAHLAPLTVADAEAQWDRQFARAPRFLEQLADEAHENESWGRLKSWIPRAGEIPAPPAVSDAYSQRCRRKFSTKPGKPPSTCSLDAAHAARRRPGCQPGQDASPAQCPEGASWSQTASSIRCQRQNSAFGRGASLNSAGVPGDPSNRPTPLPHRGPGVQPRVRHSHPRYSLHLLERIA